jgi:hypothetical protein
MREMIFVPSILFTVGAGCWSSPASALTPATCNTAPCPVAYVSINGYSITDNGANACVMPSATEPIGCNTFTDALASVTTGGTIVILDAGEYSQSITISKSVSIVSPLHATIVPPSGSPAFSIATAGVVFELNGVRLDGESGGTAGVSATNAAYVRLENTTIKNFTGSSGVVSGIDIKPGSGITMDVDVEQSLIQNNMFGIVADGTSGGIIHGTVNGSVVSGNAQNGITASTTSSSVVLMVEGTKVLGNGNHGLVAGGSNAGMLVGNSKVFNNSGGLFTTTGGTLYSYGNNDVNGNNGNDGSFTGTVSQQ